MILNLGDTVHLNTGQAGCAIELTDLFERHAPKSSSSRFRDILAVGRKLPNRLVEINPGLFNSMDIA